ncbi:protein delta homolog 1-like isoform X6 [Mercenaria mercenaria]|uniref:protein delta homolog 1-like isoform X6 n=1 Tax=Mercenaria mercenaria TaxID=6596 RepID=UPI00234EFA7B|nr:protein delta homolog 1-like isoform X6 [Mercenaria mercenaria]
MGVRSPCLLLSAYVPKGYLGCYEGKLARILDIKLKSSESNSGDECKIRCSSREYRYAGTENKVECHCGFRLKNYPMSSGCNMTCPGYEKEYCGGLMRISIYDTWQCARKPCKNNATCQDLSKDAYKCNCTDGWEGIHCNEAISTQSSVVITTTFAKSTVEIENNTSSKHDLEDTDKSSSLMTAYVLAPVGCLVVFVSMLVIVMIWK